MLDMFFLIQNNFYLKIVVGIWLSGLVEPRAPATFPSGFIKKINITQYHDLVTLALSGVSKAAIFHTDDSFLGLTDWT